MAAACGLILLLRLNRAARVAGPSVPASAELAAKLLFGLEVAGCCYWVEYCSHSGEALTQQFHHPWT